MPLLETQQLFAALSARFITWLVDNGWQVTLGEAWRSPETAALYAKEGKGITNSNHCQRLAIDLNLFSNGTYFENTDQYAAAGAYWKSLNPLCRWGGDFKPTPDGNHFSFEFEGVE